MHPGVLRRKVMFKHVASTDNIALDSEDGELLLKPDIGASPFSTNTNNSNGGSGRNLHSLLPSSSSPIPSTSLTTSLTTLTPLSRLNLFLRESMLLPLMFMYFFMLLINTILRDTKDTMLVNSVAGVSAIPILKSWVTIPTSLAFLVVYTRLAHNRRISPRARFIIILFGFTCFFAVFAFIIYPLRRYISPRTWAHAIRSERESASAAATFASTMEEWTLGLFYIVCELWSSAVCQLLFWGVANDVMTIREAKEAYPIIGAMGNAGLVVAGRLLLTFADRRDVDSARAYLFVIDATAAQQRQNATVAEFADPPVSLDPMEMGWMGTLVAIALLMCVGCVFITICHDDVYRRQRLYHAHTIKQDVEEHGTRLTNNSLTTWEAVKLLSKSEPLRLVTLLVASYGVSSSLIEVSWKGQVKRAFESTAEYSRFMGSFWTWTGLSSMACMVLSSAMLKHLGYRFAVLFTPLVMMCAGGLFFAVAVSVALAKSETGEDTASSLNIAAYAGAIAVLVSKSAKYAVFDATKEMVFIPLDRESRSVGKAAIDVVAYRLSKSGGAFALQFVLIIFGNLEDSGLVPIGALFALIVGVWMRAAFATGRLVHEAQRAENAALLHGEEEEV